MIAPVARDRIARACSIEIWMHLVIFGLIIGPILALYLPTVLFAFMLYVLAGAPGSEATPLQEVLLANWLLLNVVFGSLVLFAQIVIARRTFRIDSDHDTKSRGEGLQPSGETGRALIERVNGLWDQFAAGALPRPEVQWYANFNVLARAYREGRTPVVEVSAGLWDRVVRGDPVASGILAHEVAHIANRDPELLRFVLTLNEAAQRLLKVVIWCGLVTIGVVVLREIVIPPEGRSVWESIVRGTSIGLIGGLLVLIVPICVLAVGRYAGFIVSLVEIRADAIAAHGDRLDWFADALDADEDLRRSTVSDLAHALVTPNLTHIPEAERIALLRTPNRLLTPKVRYFALSIALMVLLPINAGTYLLEGGAIDHALIAAAVAAFHAAAVGMLLEAAPAFSLTSARALVLSAALCLSQALPQINFAAFGYLFSYLAGSIATGPVAVAQLVDDFSITIDDVATATWSALAQGRVALSILVSACALMVATLLARQLTWRTSGYLAPTIGAIAGVTSIFCSHDGSRDGFYQFWPLSLAHDFFANGDQAAWMRLCVPTLVALLCIGIVRLFVAGRQLALK